MGYGESAPNDSAMQVIPIHFDVPGHHLTLPTFIETAKQTEAVIAGFNERLFGGQLEYELIILPPEAASFKSMLGVMLVGGTIIWAFAESDIGRAFIKGVTGHEPAHWAESAGQRVRQEILETPSSSADDEGDEEAEKRQKCQAGATIVAEATKAFLQKDTNELRAAGADLASFRASYEARNAFYQACMRDKNVRAVGFEEAKRFPIRRSDFVRLQVALPPREDDRDSGPWHVEIITLKVTSPNWEREDKQRLWKGKDEHGKDRYFKIDDEHFWELVAQDYLDPHIIDTIRVQWAFREENGRPKDLRVLRVLDFNEEHLAEPLNKDALNAMLGQYTREANESAQRTLFDD